MQSSAADLPQHSDNVDEELRRVKMALTAVFSPAQQQQQQSKQWWEQRQLADRYLTSFQATSVAWMVCDRLLQENFNSTNPQEMMQQQQQRFFAAQTLHTKCRADVYQLPSDSLPSLRDSLWNKLNTYSNVGEVALTNRLAMCVSALAVQMGWTTVITDLLATLSIDATPQKRLAPHSDGPRRGQTTATIHRPIRRASEI